MAGAPDGMADAGRLLNYPKVATKCFGQNNPSSRALVVVDGPLVLLVLPFLHNVELDISPRKISGKLHIKLPFIGSG